MVILRVRQPTICLRSFTLIFTSSLSDPGLFFIISALQIGRLEWTNKSWIAWQTLKRWEDVSQWEFHAFGLHALQITKLPPWSKDNVRIRSPDIPSLFLHGYENRQEVYNRNAGDEHICKFVYKLSTQGHFISQKNFLTKIYNTYVLPKSLLDIVKKVYCQDSVLCEELKKQ